MTGASAGDSAVTVAEAYLTLLRQRGIANLYVNAGTDFAPLVEAYAKHATSEPPFPRPVLAAHENLATGMAHGAYLMTGEPQAVMFHVSVGTANAVCAVVNAARDNVPLLVTAGRTPIFEDGVVGARDTHIHWAQELFDQAGLLRELVKWDYELRDGRQLSSVVDRALSLATTDPKGPVYLTLPREVLAARYEPPACPPGLMATPTGPRPDAADVALLAQRLASARWPVIVTSASGADPTSVPLLASLCERFAVGVAEISPRYLNVPNDHRFHLGHRTDRVMIDADVVLFLECDVPWIGARAAPRPDAFVAQAGVDPLFTRYPMRTHRSDLTVSATPTSLLDALLLALERVGGEIDPARGEALAARSTATRQSLAAVAEHEAAASGPITKAFMTRALDDVLGDDAALFNEYWVAPQLMTSLRPRGYFYLPPSGGLGWALPAALGAKHAAPYRTVVAAVGDGAYLFANPAACHHASEKHGLPVLTIVADNASWGAVDNAARAVYPDGDAVRSGEDRLSNLAPSPAFERYVEASGGYGERVTTRHELRPALDRALHAVQVDGRQALLNVACV